MALLDGVRELAATAPPEEVLEALLTRSGYLAELEESLDPQDAGRVENLQELVSVAREYTERAEALAEEGGPGPPWPGSSNRWRWSPTPTRSPRTIPTTRAWSP
ncbi:hypothetical protein GCM10027605_10850 [Micromonospora zhanjiangensis]